jgi:thymidylate kinase
MIVAIEGIDGAGKSHVCKLLVNQLEARGVSGRLLERNSVKLDDEFSDRLLSNLRSIIWPGDPEPQSDPLGTHFYLYLLAAWFVALKKYVSLMPRGVHVMDGSYFRVVAKAHLRGGLDINWLQSLFAASLQPDLVLLLDVDPAVAWKRRPSFKATELGRWDGFGTDPEEAFCMYQNAIRKVLLHFAAERGWVVISQTADSPPEQIAQQIERIVLSRLG